MDSRERALIGYSSRFEIGRLAGKVGRRVPAARIELSSTDGNDTRALLVGMLDPVDSNCCFKAAVSSSSSCSLLLVVLA